MWHSVSFLQEECLTKGLIPKAGSNRETVRAEALDKS